MAPKPMGMEYKLMSDREAGIRLKNVPSAEVFRALREMKEEYGEEYDILSREAINWDLVDRVEENKRKADQKANQEVPSTPKRKRISGHKPQYCPPSDSDDYSPPKRSSKTSKKADEPAKKKSKHHHHY
ncbi:hypothetical protein F5Y04DRAFT_286347 [Hypomontagnella monticulosa]|nr:hypothetical protein F5Y04DRAFT_286347 [Hypomontagnella monticulosa]